MGVFVNMNISDICARLWFWLGNLSKVCCGPCDTIKNIFVPTLSSEWLLSAMLTAALVFFCFSFFLSLPPSLLPSFLLFSLNHNSQGFPLLFTWPPPFLFLYFSLSRSHSLCLSVCLSHSLSLPFFSLHPVLIQDVPVWVLRMEILRPWRVIGAVGTLVFASPCVSIVSVG